MAIFTATVDIRSMRCEEEDLTHMSTIESKFRILLNGLLLIPLDHKKKLPPHGLPFLVPCGLQIEKRMNRNTDRESGTGSDSRYNNPFRPDLERAAEQQRPSSIGQQTGQPANQQQQQQKPNAYDPQSNYQLSSINLGSEYDVSPGSFSNFGRIPSISYANEQPRGGTNPRPGGTGTQTSGTSGTVREGLTNVNYGSLNPSDLENRVKEEPQAEPPLTAQRRPAQRTSNYFSTDEFFSAEVPDEDEDEDFQRERSRTQARPPLDLPSPLELDLPERAHSEGELARADRRKPGPLNMSRARTQVTAGMPIQRIRPIVSSGSGASRGLMGRGPLEYVKMENGKEVRFKLEDLQYDKVVQIPKEGGTGPWTTNSLMRVTKNVNGNLMKRWAERYNVEVAGLESGQFLAYLDRPGLPPRDFVIIDLRAGEWNMARLSDLPNAQGRVRILGMSSAIITVTDEQINLMGTGQATEDNPNSLLSRAAINELQKIKNDPLIKYIIVHCEYGQSRSPGTAIGIQKLMGPGKVVLLLEGGANDFWAYYNDKARQDRFRAEAEQRAIRTATLKSVSEEGQWYASIPTAQTVQTLQTEAQEASPKGPRRQINVQIETEPEEEKQQEAPIYISSTPPRRRVQHSIQRLDTPDLGAIMEQNRLSEGSRGLPVENEARRTDALQTIGAIAEYFRGNQALAQPRDPALLGDMSNPDSPDRGGQGGRLKKRGFMNVFMPERRGKGNRIYRVRS